MNQETLVPQNQLADPEELKLLRSIAKEVHHVTQEDFYKGSFTAARYAERWWATWGKNQE